MFLVYLKSKFAVFLMLVGLRINLVFCISFVDPFMNYSKASSVKRLFRPTECKVNKIEQE